MSKQADNKTAPNKQDPADYIASLTHAGRREDALQLMAMMAEITGEKPTMWGPSIIGYGQYHYVYESGREGDSFLVGFAPRKANMVVYIMPGFSEYEALLAKLGPHKLGSSCLYLGRLNKVDPKALAKLIAQSVKTMRKKYGA